MIEEKRLKENLVEVSFPRLTGSKYEKKVFELARKKAESMDFKTKSHQFSFSTFYSRVYPKVSFFLVFCLMLILYLNPDHPIFAVISIALIILLVSLIFLTRNPEEISFGKILTSQNLYTTLEPNLKDQNNRNKLINVIFMAHLDSKGQNLTVRARWLSNLFWTISLIALSVIIILKNIIFPQLELMLKIIGLFPLILNGITTILIVINFTNNNSYGAVDNGSGIVSVLELMNYFAEKSNNYSNIKLWFVLTGAEECGTMGIRELYTREFQNLDRESTYFFNFESVGRTGNIVINETLTERNPSFYRKFEELAEEFSFNIYLKKTGFTVHTDGIYMLQHGYNLIEYTSDDIYQYMHSLEDNVDKVDTNLLKEICEFCVKAVEILD